MVDDPLEILELRRAIAGATAAEIRKIITDRLPCIAPPSSGPEFDAWTWSLYDLGLAAETIPDPSTALGLYTRSIEYNRTTELLRSAAFVRSGLCLEQLGRWLEAKRLYKQALPGSFGWPQNRAILLWRLGRLECAAEEPEQALSSFGQLLDLLPQEGISAQEVTLEWASCLQQTGQTQPAAEQLEALSEQAHPLAVEALVRLSSLLLQQGESEAACRALERAVTHPMADPATRSAANLRLDQLQTL
jgi:tetratricopeptide (TPR) repeat protein